MKFYSWTHNINDRRLAKLKESAQKYNLEINYLGTNLKTFGTTTTKARLLYEKLCQLDDNQIVCAVDGFDVFFCAGVDQIKQRYLDFNCDVVISAEREYAHQYPKYKEFYDRSHCKTPYPYINSGTIMGYAGALRKIYAPTLSTIVQPKIFTGRSIRKIKQLLCWIKRKLNLKTLDENFLYSYIYYTDMQHVGKYIAINPENLNIRLDHETKIVWCCAHEWDDINDHFRVEGSKIINSHTNNAPLIIHVPGGMSHYAVFEKLYEVQKYIER